MDLTFNTEKDVIKLDLAKLNPDQIKALADKLQFGLVVSLVESINRIDTTAATCNAMKSRVADYLQNKLNEEIETGLLDLNTAADLFQKLTNIGVSVAEVKRKVFNGKELLKVDLLTKQERVMMDLLRTINTPDKKQKLVDFIHSLDDFDIADVSVKDKVSDNDFETDSEI